MMSSGTPPSPSKRSRLKFWWIVMRACSLIFHVREGETFSRSAPASRQPSLLSIAGVHTVENSADASDRARRASRHLVRVEAAAAVAEIVGSVGLRLLSHDVDRAADGAPTVEQGTGSFQDLHAFDVVGLRAVAVASHAHPVHQHDIEPVTIVVEEAANRVLFVRAVPTHRLDTGCILQSIRDGVGALLPQQFLGNRAHLGRNVVVRDGKSGRRGLAG